MSIRGCDSSIGTIWEVSANIVEKFIILEIFEILQSVLLAQVCLDALTRGIGALAGSGV